MMEIIKAIAISEIRAEKAEEEFNESDKEYYETVLNSLVLCKTLEEKGFSGVCDLMKNEWINDIMKKIGPVYVDGKISTLDKVVEILMGERPCGR